MKTKINCRFFVLTALLIISVAAYGQQVAALLTVNGHEIKGKVLEIDGKHFVAIEDLAQSLGGTVSYSGGIALTLPQSSSAQSRQTESGRIKGTLTYFFNANDGNKPDTGSQVWLVKGHIDIPSDWFFGGGENDVLTYKELVAGSPGYKYEVLKHTVADGNGNFELPDVPVGEYTLVIQSKHTRNSFSPPLPPMSENEKKEYVAALKADRSEEGSLKYMGYFTGVSYSKRDRNGRLNVRDVSVKASQTADASVDFGGDAR